MEENNDKDCSEQSGIGFLHVKKKKKTNSQVPSTTAVSTGVNNKRKQPLPSDSADPKLLRNNKFALLAEDKGNDDTIAKKERVPPLFTPIRDLLKLQEELSKLSLKPLYKKCSKGTKIVCSNMKEYELLSNILETQKVPFYTHDNPSTKPLKAVLRGLPVHTTAAVKSELEELGLKPEAVFPMKQRSQDTKDDPFRNELFLVHFTKGSTTIAALRSIKSLFQTIVQWEPYRPQHRDVTQCTNCLWFGHGTRNCKMKPRCVKCSGDHSSVICTQSDDIEPKCANCAQNHRATSRLCPKRAEFIRIRKAASTANQNGRHRKHPPDNTKNQFPQTRHVVPVLKPLPLNQPNRDATLKYSVQPRLTAAADEANKSSTPPGLSYAGVTAGSFTGASAGSTVDDAPLSTEELVKIISAAFEIQRKYKTRSQQLAAIVALISNNGP